MIGAPARFVPVRNGVTLVCVVCWVRSTSCWVGTNSVGPELTAPHADRSLTDDGIVAAIDPAKTISATTIRPVRGPPETTLRRSTPTPDHRRPSPSSAASPRTISQGTTPAHLHAAVRHPTDPDATARPNPDDGSNGGGQTRLAPKPRPLGVRRSAHNWEAVDAIVRLHVSARVHRQPIDVVTDGPSRTRRTKSQQTRIRPVLRSEFTSKRDLPGARAGHGSPAPGTSTRTASIRPPRIPTVSLGSLLGAVHMYSVRRSSPPSMHA